MQHQVSNQVNMVSRGEAFWNMQTPDALTKRQCDIDI